MYSSPEQAGAFDAVLTCFFLDTAHNALRYLETIGATLRRGGLWLHLGPLLWHWADGGYAEQSVELSLSELHRAARLLGFRPLRQQFVDASYIGACA